MKQLTLVFIVRGQEVLLGFKKRGFGAGRYNGFGGKVESGETIEAAARRELLEEVGIQARQLQSAGTLIFSFADSTPTLEVHIFTCSDYEGVETETDEMRPDWFLIHALPLDQMWPDDRYWLPFVLGGQKCQGSFHFDKPTTPQYTSQIIQYSVSCTNEPVPPR